MPNVDVLFCLLLNDIDVFVVPKPELVLVAVPNPPRLFPKIVVPPNVDAGLLLIFPNIDVLFEEPNSPPPNGLLLCTPNILFEIHVIS